MPVKTYKKKAYKKKAYKKRNYSSRKKLVKLIKSISLRNSETKCVHKSEENIQLNHNSGYQIQQLLYTQQGITDTGAGTAVYSNRLGDEVIARGISIKMWVATKLDRPNVQFRFVVYKYQSATFPNLASCFKGMSANRLLDDLDTEDKTIVYQKLFYIEKGFSGNANVATAGREAHKLFKCWIPLKNKKITYNDAGTVPKFHNYGFFIVPYDSFGTLGTDIIASFSYNYKFYFKDP